MSAKPASHPGRLLKRELAARKRSANRLSLEAGNDVGRQVDRAYRLALGRSPEPDERARAVGVVHRAGLPALARAIFNCNEFLYFD